MCQANIVGHWLDGSPTAEERERRKAALEAVVRLDELGCRVLDGPAVLDLIKRWDRAFEWEPGRHPGLLVTDGPRLVTESGVIEKLLRP